jgi:hypothetical protein
MSAHQNLSMSLQEYTREDDECTPEFVNEFARIHSLPTMIHSMVRTSRDIPNGFGNEIKRYMVFTKYNHNHYLVAEKSFVYFYSRYGFCPACGILRCGVFVAIKNYAIHGPATTENSTTLLRNLRHRQTLQMMPIWMSYGSLHTQWFDYSCCF